MSDTETSTPVLPSDEDRFVFPETWKRLVRPRRGQGRARRLKLDPAAGERFRAQFEPKVRDRLAHEANREHAAAGTAFLDGADDVPGAAAVMALTRPATYHEPPVDRLSFDMVATERGLPFAAAALAEALTLEIAVQGTERSIVIRRRAMDGSRWSTLYGSSELRAIRGHIAALPDAEYDAVTAALAERRTDPERRLAASLLAPDVTAWVDQICAEHRDQPTSWAATRLVLEMVTTPEQLDALDVDSLPYSWVQAAEIADLLHRLGPAALPVVERYLGGHCDTAEKKALFRALAAIPTDRAMALLLDRLADPTAMTFAMEAAANFPRRALRIVADRLPEADAEARKRLSALLYADPVLLETALPLQDAAVREPVEALVAGRRRRPAAPPEAVPPLLLAPPWERAGTAAETVVVTGLTPPPISRLAWAEGERERWAATDVHGSAPADWDAEVQTFPMRNHGSQARTLALAPREVALELLPQWTPGATYIAAGLLRRLLANFGEAVLDRVVEAADAGGSALREAHLPIANLTIARRAADTLAHLKSMRPLAIDWLDRHAADAAALLVPDALGKAKRRRAGAEAALRHIATVHGAVLVREAAARYGAEAAAAVDALLDTDPLLPVGVAIPVPGTWVAPMALPQVLLAGREHALPDAAVRNLAAVLALGTPEYEYPGVAIVADACDRESLAGFSLALFEQWLTVGAPSEDGWAVTQLAHFGDDEAVRALAPLIGRWPGESQHPRAVKGLKVLGAIGTEAALRAIQGIAEKAKFAAIKAEAGAQIEAIAARLGLSAEQLADRLVPDFGLREASALVLDYGPRRFKVGFDEQLKPYVTDMDGKPRKSLPKPGAKDDDLLAGAAYKRFAALRKDLRTVAAEQVRRLERAMVSGRAWTLAEFEEYFVGHPLVWHLARRLVWTADTPDGTVAFRLAEDRSRTGVDEEELKLDEAAAVRLAHPARLGAEVAAWAEIFADYEIVQPFAQLSRPVMAFTEEELRTGRLTRFEGATVPVGRLLGLVGKGWERAAPQDAGCEPGMSSPLLHGSERIVIGLEPGIWVGAVDIHPNQTLREVVVAERDFSGWGLPEAKAGFGPVDPVAASEALTALARATETE